MEDFASYILNETNLPDKMKIGRASCRERV